MRIQSAFALSLALPSLVKTQNSNISTIQINKCKTECINNFADNFIFQATACLKYSPKQPCDLDQIKVINNHCAEIILKECIEQCTEHNTKIFA